MFYYVICFMLLFKSKFLLNYINFRRHMLLSNCIDILVYYFQTLRKFYVKKIYALFEIEIVQIVNKDSFVKFHNSSDCSFECFMPRN